MKIAFGADAIILELGGEVGANGINLDLIVAAAKARKGKTRVLQIAGVPGEFDGLNNELATKDLIRQWANAIGDLNPLWRSDDYAGDTLHGGIVAPPTFFTCIACPTTGVRTRVPGVVAYNAGTKWERFGEIHVGDTLRVLETYGDIEVKSSVPPLWVQHLTRRYLNQRGQLVAIAYSRLFEALAPETESGKWSYAPGSAEMVTRYKYSDEELEAISHAYDVEERRGGDIRYWEDVEPGEELKPIVKGPVGFDETVAFLGVWGGLAGHGLLHRAYELEAKYGASDPITGVTCIELCAYLDDDLAKVFGLTVAAIPPALIQAWMGHLITNWMGDDGFLRVLDCEPERISHHGDTFWLKGKVANKCIRNDEHLVDIESHVEDQLGQIHVRGHSTVRLVSRTMEKIV